MENNSYGWGINVPGFGMTMYTIENGSPADIDLVEAFFAGDKIKIIEALDKGANINLKLKIDRERGESRKGCLLYHLVTEEPEKERYIESPMFIDGAEINDRYMQQKRERDYDNACSREYDRVKKINKQRAESIIDLMHFWLDIGGSLCDVNAENFQYSRRLHISDKEIDSNVKFKAVREYIKRARDIDALVLDSMNTHLTRVPVGEEKVTWFRFFLDWTTKYRESGLSIEKIRGEVGLDSREANN